MHALITGASGFIGRALLEHLAENEMPGTALSRRAMSQMPEGWRWQSREQVLSGDFEIKPDVVIHLEVKQHVQNPSAGDVEEFDRVNAGGTGQWLAWASARG